MVDERLFQSSEFQLLVLIITGLTVCRFVVSVYKKVCVPNWTIIIITNSITSRIRSSGSKNILIKLKFVGFQFLTAASMKIIVFWDVAPCSLVEADRRFWGAHCLHHQDNRRSRHWNVGKFLLDYTTPRRQSSSDLTLVLAQLSAGSRWNWETKFK
jgi:hypothetical protein